MRAAWYSEYGSASDVFKFDDIPDPIAGDGEVVVKVYSSGLNPTDWKSRMGSRGPFMYDLIVPHHDGSGVIIEVGPGVERSRIGERVWLYAGQWQRPMGTAAEFIAVPGSQAASLSDGLTFDEGACLGVPALTAHRCLFADGSISGQTILVTGGAGAVGHYAIQLAKWAGARVITTVSSTNKSDRAKNAGADHTINYRSDNVIEAIQDLTYGEGVDRIVEVDFGGNLTVSQQILKIGGVISPYASTTDRRPAIEYQAFSQRNISFRFVTVFRVSQEDTANAVVDINQAIADEALWHPIAQRFRLSDIATAHDTQEANIVMGNIIVEVDKV